MSVLGDWLKQLILIVMISIVAEMLLPTKATEKYVRAVLGVAIIATMLNPIIPLLKGNWEANVANSATTHLFDTASAVPTANQTEISDKLYQDTLHSEEAAQADTLLASSLRESLPENVRSHVGKIEVQNALTPPEMLVTVSLRTGNQSLEDEVTAAICASLKISATQVIVMVDGGN